MNVARNCQWSQLRTMDQAASALTRISPVTAITVTRRLIANASGVSVRSHAARKFPHSSGQGKLKPVAGPVWAGDLSAMAMAKYSGTRTIRAQIARRIVSPQLTRMPSGRLRRLRGRIAGAATATVFTWVAIRDSLLGAG